MRSDKINDSEKPSKKKESMPERETSLSPFEVYMTAFQKAETEYERIAVAKEAASDPHFEPTKHKNMDYTLDQHQNDGRGLEIYDIDLTLFNNDDPPTKINTELLESRLKMGIVDVYLYSSMGTGDLRRKEAPLISRVDLIAYLSLMGFRVCGLITQGDTANNNKFGDYYELYHNALTTLIPDEKEKIITVLDHHFAVSEKQRIKFFRPKNDEQDFEDQYVVHAGYYGAKSRMYEHLLKQFPKLTKINAFDDAAANLLGGVHMHSRSKSESIFVPYLVHPAGKAWSDDYSASKKKEPTIENFLIEMIQIELNNFSKGQFREAKAYVNLENLTNKLLQKEKVKSSDCKKLKKCILALTKPVFTSALPFLNNNFEHLDIISTIYNHLIRGQKNMEPISLIAHCRKEYNPLMKKIIDDGIKSRAATRKKIGKPSSLGLHASLPDSHTEKMESPKPKRKTSTRT